MQNESFQNTNAIPPMSETIEKKPSWNVIVTIREQGLRDARRALRQFGTVEVSSFFNVLVMHVEDLDEFLHDFALVFSKKPYLEDSISRVTPVMRSFIFNSRDEFEHKVMRITEVWLDRLTDKTFYVRMHRRGFKESMKSVEEEQFLDRYILNSLKERGTSAKVSFSDPDYVIDIESLNNQGGLSIWSRDEMKLYPFLNLD